MRAYNFGTLSPKRSSEELLVSFEWYTLLANFWQPGVVYAANSYVRPLAPTGFAYKRTGGGVSGATEPNWPHAVGGTVVDGSGGWECVEAQAYGYNTPSTPVCAVSPAGLTLGSALLVDGEGPDSRVQVLISGGTSGVRYFVRSKISVGSEVLEGTAVLPIDDTV